MSSKSILNINLPPVSLNEVKSFKVTKLGHRVYSDFIKEEMTCEVAHIIGSVGRHRNGQAE